jgi:hypothetical protein
MAHNMGDELNRERERRKGKLNMNKTVLFYIQQQQQQQCIFFRFRVCVFDRGERECVWVVRERRYLQKKFHKSRASFEYVILNPILI